MQLADIDFIYFDLDDTLWDFSANSPIALRHTYDHFGFAKYAPEYDRFKEIYLAKNAELWDLYHYGKIEKEFLETERFRYVIEAIGAPEHHDLAFCTEVNNEYLRFLATLPTLVAGAETLVKRLHALGIRMGILSNGFAGIQEQKLVSGGIRQYFSEIVLSDNVGITKPLKGIFEYAQKMANADSRRILMIGDNYEVDILGAQQLGWKTIYLNRKDDAAEHNKADSTVNTLTEIEL